jgi:membrane protein implicated in regulation of membrane protease activity
LYLRTEAAARRQRPGEETAVVHPWRDRWFALGIVGTIATCLACVTPVAVVALAWLGAGAWAGHLDTALILLLIGFAALAVHRYRRARKAWPDDTRPEGRP